MTYGAHPAFGALRKLGALGEVPKKTKPVLDSACNEKDKDEQMLDAADTFTESQLRLDVAAAVQEWAETTPGDLDEGETMADRLVALLVGLADDNKDGDITPDEEVFLSGAMEVCADYLMSKGATEADVMALLNDGSADAGDRVAEFLKGELPNGPEASADDIDSFAFDADSSASIFDNVLDAVYKKKVVVRGGRKMRVMKRISGRVVLSAAQKVAIRKARRKAHSGIAKMRRAKSMKIRARAGL